jgi:uncharacterized protein (UPF0548 family)
MRRSSYDGRAVSYGAVGGTQAADLLSFPPKGYRPSRDESRLGSGGERFQAATNLLMTWGVQRGSAIEVHDITPDAGGGYLGVTFDPCGKPISSVGESHDHRFSPDGVPFIAAGTDAVFRTRIGPIILESPVRVVYLVDESRRQGYAVGTLEGHQLSGEELFVVEWRDDDSVWLVVRSFSKPATLVSRLGWPVVRAIQRAYVRRFLFALRPERGL